MGMARVYLPSPSSRPRKSTACLPLRLMNSAASGVSLAITVRNTVISIPLNARSISLPPRGSMMLSS